MREAHGFGGTMHTWFTCAEQPLNEVCMSAACTVFAILTYPRHYIDAQRCKEGAALHLRHHWAIERLVWGARNA